MDQIRVILAGMPGILRDVVSSLVKEQPDMVVVAETESATHLPALSRRLRADIVIIGADRDGMSAAGRSVVNRRPHVKLLAVAEDGRRAWLYELRPHEQQFGDICPTELVGAIRSAMRNGAIPMEITGESSISTPTS